MALKEPRLVHVGARIAEEGSWSDERDGLLHCCGVMAEHGARCERVCLLQIGHKLAEM